jgi:uncharacterized membrane protein YjgN (DUF898 family)
MSYGVKCPKCGMMQLPGPTCKSCKAALGGPPRRPATPPSPGPVAPPPRRPPDEARAWSAAADRAPEPAVRPDPAGGKASRRLAFQGTGGSLFGIQILNGFLTIVTLGIYYFWGKVKVRQYLFGQTVFDGDRFTFHGTGQELLLGTVKAMGIFLLPIMLLGNLPGLLRLPWWVDALAGLLAYLLFITFLPVAMVGARRYRMSRTSWRGIHFSFRGDLREFVKLFWAGGALTTITLGLYYPYFQTRQQAFFVGHTFFGTQGFDFDGEGRDLFGGFLLAALLVPFTFGLSWIWYQAKKRRYFWEHTRIGAARFRFPITGGMLLSLYLVNALLLIVTLGMAWSWVVVRNARFVCRHLSLEGPLDLEAILQEAGDASAVGEGLAGILDTDLGIGV